MSEFFKRWFYTQKLSINKDLNMTHNFNTKSLCALLSCPQLQPACLLKLLLFWNELLICRVIVLFSYEKQYKYKSCETKYEYIFTIYKSIWQNTLLPKETQSYFHNCVFFILGFKMLLIPETCFHVLTEKRYFPKYQPKFHPMLCLVARRVSAKTGQQNCFWFTFSHGSKCKFWFNVETHTLHGDGVPTSGTRWAAVCTQAEFAQF